MKVLLVDNDRELVDLLRYMFVRDHHTVVTAFDGAEALRVFEREAPDLVVLDVMMPKRSGIEVLKEIRAAGETPVIMLTGVGDEDRVVHTLGLGADEYVIKPFRPRELLARAEGVYRRSRAYHRERAPLSGPMTCGAVTLDPQRHEVYVAGRLVRVTPTEFALLQYLVLNHGIALSAQKILGEVWGHDAEENDDVVRVTVARLRSKIEPDPANPRYIVTVPGGGYMCQDQK